MRSSCSSQQSKWWDIEAQHTTWGGIAIREDEWQPPEDMLHWLNSNNYSYNAGWETTGNTKVTVHGRKLWEFYGFIRFYDRFAALHYVVSWP